MTLDDACQYLSLALNEPVKKSDLFQLALDGNLILSVHLINTAKALIGKLIPKSEANTFKLSGPFSEEMTKTFGPNVKLDYLEGVNYSEELQLILEDKIYTIDDIWDLPLVGNETYDIAHLFQCETGGPSVDTVSMDGTFLINDTDQGKVVAQLQERFEADFIKEMDPDRPFHSPQNYFPAGKLPDDCSIIVRTKNLTALLKSISTPSEQPSTKTRNSYLSTIRHLSDALVDGLTDKPNKDALSVIQALSFKGIELDIGEKTLAKYLKSAQENL